ncbi:MAG: ABC transporter permease [Vicinamibacterales bacterium]|nr:ABC transporter permease [Vicinamibacterales bacterium]
MDRFRQDLTLAIRLLWKDRGFTTTTVLTLAVCLAANAAIFAVVNAVLLRPLPFPEPDRLVMMFNAYPGVGAVRGSNGVPDYFDRLEQTEAFEALALYRTTGVTVGGGGQGDPERLTAMMVTPSFYDVLRAEPQVGRLLDESDAVVGQDQRVLLSHGLWQRAFGGRPDVAGQDLRINGVPYTVTGVMPASFRFVDPEVQLWMPAAFSPEDRGDDTRHSNSWQMFGRLRDGATLAEAQGQIDAINARNLERFPALKELLINAGFHTPVFLLQEDLVASARPTVLLLWGGVLFVLAIGCVNVANLASVRATSRARELVTRMALGATMSRLMQQTLTEALLVAAAGGAAGLLLGWWSLQTVGFLGLDQLPRGTEIALDREVLLYTFGLVTLVGLAVGTWPAVALARTNIGQALREEGRSGTPTRAARLMRRALVTSQVAFALVLLLGAGLLLASFDRLLAVDPGFRPEGVITGTISLPAARYPDAAALRTVASRITERVAAQPGVRVAGLTSSIPFGINFSDSVILAEGYQMAPGESLISPTQVAVSEGYFEAMGATLVDGRFIDARDGESAPRAIMIDARVARRFWPDGSAVGRRMFMPANPNNLLEPPPDDQMLTVVGVIKDMRLRRMDDGGDSGLFGAYFLPNAQSPRRTLTIAARTDGDPASLGGALRTAVAGIDPELVVYAISTMDDRLDRALMDRRTPMVLAVGFAAVALLLAAIGIYGVLAYQVRQRSREIGIRMALGAGRPAIFGMVLGEAGLIVSAGLVIGLGVAMLLRTALESQLYGVSFLDPLVIATVAGVLLLVTIVACVLPARRAATTNPVEALNL